METQRFAGLDTSASSTTLRRRGKRAEAERPRLTDEEVFGHYARTGSEESFQTIFKRYQPRIHGFLVKRINDPVIADDLTQNIFVRILRNASKFDTNRDFSKWVFTIVNNVLKNHYRTLSRDRMHAFTDMASENAGEPGSRPGEFDAPSDERAPDREAFCSELRTELSGALQRLDPQLREVFVLYQVDGNPYRAVAEKLGLPLETVKHRSGRARTQLRDVLAAFAG